MYGKLTKAEAKLFLFILHFPGLTYTQMKKEYTKAETTLKNMGMTKADSGERLELATSLGAQSSLSERLKKLCDEGYIQKVGDGFEILIDSLIIPFKDRTYYNYEVRDNQMNRMITEGVAYRIISIPRNLLEKFIRFIQNLSGGEKQKVIGYIDKRYPSGVIIFQHLYNVLADIRAYLSTKINTPHLLSTRLIELNKEGALTFSENRVSVDEYDDCDRMVGKVSEIVKVIDHFPEQEPTSSV